MLNKAEWNKIQRMIGAAARQNNPEQVDEIRRDFYVYGSQAGTTAIPLAPGASANSIINIEADSDFILQKFTYEADESGVAFTDSTRPLPNVNVLLTDSGSGRQLMQNPTPIPSIFGTGELPFILSNPRFFSRNTTIQVAYTNFDVAASYVIRLSFIGYKIYGTQ